MADATSGGGSSGRGASPTLIPSPLSECPSGVIRQMRPGPATRAALLSRNSGCRRSLRPENPVQRVHPALEGRISLEAATPGRQFTEVNRSSPDDSLSRNHRQTLKPESAVLQNVRALTACTLRDHARPRKRKHSLPCAETVEVGDFLWKGTGKVGS